LAYFFGFGGGAGSAGAGAGAVTTLEEETGGAAGAASCPALA
jgi:hypothetical protein